MKTILLPIIMSILAVTVLAQGHHTSGGRTYSYRAPQEVQTKAISREPVYAWEGGEEYLAEQPDGSFKRMPSQKQRVLKGYNVTYRTLYDDGSSTQYTVFESAN